jgi:hypothetical protein
LMALDSQMAHERERETKEEETKAKVVIWEYSYKSTYHIGHFSSS